MLCFIPGMFNILRPLATTGLQLVVQKMTSQSKWVCTQIQERRSSSPTCRGLWLKEIGEKTHFLMNTLYLLYFLYITKEEKNKPFFAKKNIRCSCWISLESWIANLILLIIRDISN